MLKCLMTASNKGELGNKNAPYNIIALDLNFVHFKVILNVDSPYFLYVIAEN